MTRKILILHDLSVGSRRTNRDHVYNFAKYQKGNLYIFQSANALVTDALKKIKFDGVIINYCFLGYRASSLYPFVKKRYEWLRDLQCPKIAICQDDYTDNKILDDWLEFIDATVIYSPIQNHVDVLYPQNWGKKKFKLGLTAYTDSAQMNELREFQKPFAERTIDVGTRVRYLPPQFGWYGQVKGRSAEDFRDAAERAGFTTDISTSPQDVIFGNHWLRFVGNCKFTLGSKGGSSMADPEGKIRHKIAQYMQENPDADFSDIENACFQGLDGHYVFAGVSPRLFEAAALKTCQILIRDEYVGDIEPYTDYIPLNQDLSNLNEVFELMRNHDRCEAMIDSCYKKLIESNQFDYSVFVDDVLSEIEPAEPMLSDQDIDLVLAHFEELKPFLDVKNNHDNFLARLWARKLGFVAYADELPDACSMFDLPNDLLGCPTAALTLTDIDSPSLAASAIPEVLAIAHSQNGNIDDLRFIAEHAAKKEYVYEELDVWWDMCEYIYEPLSN